MDLVAKKYMQEGMLQKPFLEILPVAAVLSFPRAIIIMRTFTHLMLKSTARTFFNTFREDHEMLHLRDLQKLEGVLTPSHLEVIYLILHITLNTIKSLPYKISQAYY